MGTKYADRAFISMNGAFLVDVQSATLRQNKNAKAVNVMTFDGFNRGFVQGNRDIDVSIVIALNNVNPRPKFESFDYAAADFAFTYTVGAETFVVTGLFDKDAEDNAGGVGDEVKSTFNFGALRVADGNGNPVEFADFTVETGLVAAGAAFA